MSHKFYPSIPIFQSGTDTKIEAKNPFEKLHEEAEKEEQKQREILFSSLHEAQQKEGQKLFLSMAEAQERKDKTEELADRIIKMMQDFGLEPEEMLEVLELTRQKIEKRKQW